MNYPLTARSDLYSVQVGLRYFCLASLEEYHHSQSPSSYLHYIACRLGDAGLTPRPCSMHSDLDQYRVCLSFRVYVNWFYRIVTAIYGLKKQTICMRTSTKVPAWRISSLYTPEILPWIRIGMEEPMKIIQGHFLEYTNPLQLSHFPMTISRVGNGVYPSDLHTAILRKALEACLGRAFCVLDFQVSATATPGCKTAG